MKRAAIYMRVSTDKQAQEGDSIPAQREALRKYVDNHEDMIVAGEYLDDGVSGTRADRDELQRLLEDVKAGRVDLILVTKLDRWFRSIRHYVNTQEILDRYNVGWTAIWEPIYDTTTPQGRLIVNQMMSIAQFEAENTGQRVKQVFQHKVKVGEVITGAVPVGYEIKDKHLVPSSLADDVVNAFTTFATTNSLTETVRQAPVGLPKTNAGMKRLLKNRKYIGEYRDIKDYCPALITKELFDTVQLQLSRNIKCDQKHIYLFSGLLVCDECKCKMQAYSRKLRNKTVLMYRCPQHYNRVTKICHNTKIIYESVLEKYLVENLTSLIKDAVIEAEMTAKPIQDAKKKKATLEKKIARLKELYVEDLISLDEYKADREKYQTELNTIQMPVKCPTSQIQAFDIEGGVNLYTALDRSEKRLFWRSIIKEIAFDNNRKTTIYFF